MADIVDVAISQLGVNETNGGHVKYIKYFNPAWGPGTAWCACFVSWCANQAGIPQSSLKKYAGCTLGMEWFKGKGRFKKRGQYTPKRGDIVFFCTNRSHTGIVEKVVGNTLHTVEGNTSNKVGRRTYPLSNATITGYGLLSDTGSKGGLPNYGTGSNQSNGTTQTVDVSKENNDAAVTQELAYLKKVLDRKDVSGEKITGDVVASTKKDDVNVTLLISNSKNKFVVPVLDDVQLVLERIGSPGKLTFKTIPDSKYPIEEGNAILLTVDKKEVFFGFVFAIQNQKDGILNITAYDQMRYLKNKDSYLYKNKTANQLVKMIAEDHRLSCGSLVNTKYKLSRVEEGQTLFDIILNALDETLLQTGELYTLYDKAGYLTLKNISKMKLNIVLDGETGEEFTYQTSIEDTYNQVKITYENKENSTLDAYVVKHGKNINKWGVLQHYEKVSDARLAKPRAHALLNFYNKKKKSLSIDDAFGNTSVVAGSLLAIILDLGGTKVQNYMLVDKVTHKFSNRQHTMSLQLSGGEFTG